MMKGQLAWGLVRGQWPALGKGQLGEGRASGAASKRGQLSMDLMVVASFVLVIFLFLFELYAQNSENARIFGTQLAAQRVSEDVARAIDHAWLAGNGSVTHAQLPGSLPNSIPYNVTIRGRQVLVLYQAGGSVRIASAGTATSNVTATNFTIASGSGRYLNATNINGTVGVAG